MSREKQIIADALKDVWNRGIMFTGNPADPIMWDRGAEAILAALADVRRTCGNCGHDKATHRRRNIAKLGEAFRVCIEPVDDPKAVCGCTVYAPPGVVDALGSLTEQAQRAP